MFISYKFKYYKYKSKYTKLKKILGGAVETNETIPVQISFYNQHKETIDEILETISFITDKIFFQSLAKVSSCDFIQPSFNFILYGDKAKEICNPPCSAIKFEDIKKALDDINPSKGTSPSQGTSPSKGTSPSYNESIKSTQSSNCIDLKDIDLKDIKNVLDNESVNCADSNEIKTIYNLYYISQQNEIDESKEIEFIKSLTQFTTILNECHKLMFRSNVNYKTVFLHYFKDYQDVIFEKIIYNSCVYIFICINKNIFIPLCVISISPEYKDDSKCFYYPIRRYDIRTHYSSDIHILYFLLEKSENITNKLLQDIDNDGYTNFKELEQLLLLENIFKYFSPDIYTKDDGLLKYFCKNYTKITGILKITNKIDNEISVCITESKLNIKDTNLMIYIKNIISNHTTVDFVGQSVRIINYDLKEEDINAFILYILIYFMRGSININRNLLANGTIITYKFYINKFVYDVKICSKIFCKMFRRIALGVNFPVKSELDKFCVYSVSSSFSDLYNLINDFNNEEPKKPEYTFKTFKSTTLAKSYCFNHIFIGYDLFPLVMKININPADLSGSEFLFLDGDALEVLIMPESKVKITKVDRCYTRFKDKNNFEDEGEDEDDTKILYQNCMLIECELLRNDEVLDLTIKGGDPNGKYYTPKGKGEGYTTKCKGYTPKGEGKGYTTECKGNTTECEGYTPKGKGTGYTKGCKGNTPKGKGKCYKLNYEYHDYKRINEYDDEIINGYDDDGIINEYDGPSSYTSIIKSIKKNRLIRN